MMTRIALIALFAFVGSIARADPVADEVKKLQGVWQVVEAEANGKKVAKGDADAKNMQFVIKDNDLTSRAADGTGAKRQKTFTVDPAKTPKEIDITSLDGQEKGTTVIGIYKLEGDRLTICMPFSAMNPNTRPKEFKVAANDGLMLITLERMKAK